VCGALVNELACVTKLLVDLCSIALVVRYANRVLGADSEKVSASTAVRADESVRARETGCWVDDRRGFTDSEDRGKRAADLDERIVWRAVIKLVMGRDLRRRVLVDVLGLVAVRFWQHGGRVRSAVRKGGEVDCVK
jgi:hypothetical protein